ncbi:MAG: HAMP domain-containing protein [Anaerolineales bacterium]|nr:HAMP domain-containing protein [Anaerolineales bacterium]
MDTKSKPSLSLRYAIPGTLALLIIIAVSLTGWLGYTNGVASVELLSTRLGEETTTRIEEHIAAFVDVPFVFHELNLANLESGDVSLGSYDQMRELFWKEVFVSKSVPYLYYGTKDGYFMGIDTQFGGLGGEPVYKILSAETQPNRVTYSLSADGTPLEEIASSEYYPLERPWYKAALEKGDMAWSPIYPFSSFPVLGISPVAPVKDPKTGEIIGVLGIDLTLGELSDFLHNLEISVNGVAFIIERTGTMVATSLEEPPFTTDENGKPALLSVMDSPSPLINEIAHFLSAEFGDFTQIQGSQFKVYETANERFFIQVTPITDEHGLDWLSIVVIPASDFMAAVYTNLRNTFILGLSVMIIATIAGYILASYIIRPVFVVTDAAASIEEAKWELEPLDAIAGRSDEVGQLARVFRGMAQEVRTRERQLKQQIRELTIQIDQTKKETQVKEIVDSDFFQDLQTRAEKLRRTRRRSTEDDDPTPGETPPPQE